MGYRLALFALSLAGASQAQQALYAQCGGTGWTGGTTCVAGATCQAQNEWYSQCLPGTAATTATTQATTVTSKTTTTTTSVQATGSGTIHLCGDSTMAKGGGGSGTEGWGPFLQYSFNAQNYVVHNDAIGGRSARSYTREGRFQAVADEVKAGDWVVVEFGHNDGGSLTPTDNGRSDCYGDGAQTCQTTYNGVAETVLTYPAYYKNAAALFLAKGAKVILSSATPNNICESGTCSWGPSRFDYYAWLAASQAGGPSKGVWHVPHGNYAAQAMMNLGAATVNAGYPVDHTHPGPYISDIMARSFVLGLKCGTSPLGQAAINSTASLTSTILGPCISFNSTVPI